MKKLFWRTMLISVLGFSLIFPNYSYASTATAGYISNIIVLPGGFAVFNQSGVRAAVPSCGAGNPIRWAFNVNNAEGQARFAALMTAFSMHKTITINGKGDCTEWLDTESVSYFTINE